MATLESRIAAIEARRHPAPLPGLVLLLRDEPTPAERAAIARAESEGRHVVLVRCVDESMPEPDIAMEIQ